MKEIDDLMNRNDLFQVSFSRSIKPGQMRMATLIPKGSGKWLHGYGATAAEAFADLVRQLDDPQPAPAPARPTLPGMPAAPAAPRTMPGMPQPKGTN